MFYPTGNLPNGKVLVCILDEEDLLDEAIENCDKSNLLEGIKKWLEENNYCVEKWQLKEYLKGKGLGDKEINEELGGAPVAGLATVGTVSGMGNPAPPSPSGATNAGFYNSANNGSGDKFPSLTVGTPAAGKKKNKIVSTYIDFVKKRKTK